MVKRKNIVSFVALVLAIGMLLSACGGAKGPSANQPAGTAQSSGAKEAPTKISILAIFWSQEPVPKDNAVLKELEKRTNTDLDIQWVAANAFEEKVSAMVATGDLPDYTRIGKFIAPQTIAMARQGAFWDITSQIKNYKNLSALPPEEWKYTKIDGKNYGVPYFNPVYGGYFFNVRTDWLDKLGLKKPETMDDLYNAMKAFTKNDPDKNGKADTVGLAITKNELYVVLNVFNQTSGDWKLVDGKVQSVLTQPGTRKALEWLQNAYKEGILVRDIATMNSSQVGDLMYGGKAGVTIAKTNGSTSTSFNVKKIDPTAECWPLPYIVGGEGTKMYSKESPFGSVFVIPKKSVKEDKLKKILAFADYGWSPEGSVLTKWGFENDQHTKNGDLFIKTEKGLKDNFANLDNLFVPVNPYQTAAGGTGVTVERYNKLREILDEQKKNGVDNIGVNLISDTYVQYGPDIIKQSEDLKIQIIIGQKSLADWDAYIAKLKADPNFQKILKEMDDYYQKNK